MIDVSERTLASLGFEDLRSSLAGRCRTEVGRARAQVRGFLATKDEVVAALALVDEARVLLSEPLSLPLGGLTDTRPALERAARGAMLEPAELVAICQALFAFERTNEMLEERQGHLPRMARLGSRLPVLSRLATRLDRTFETSGELSDRASEGLREAREQARGLHKRIRGRLDELLRDERFQLNLQEIYYSVRNDRYVVPVKSSHQREVDGIVHNASQTGQTLFVEPKELILLGNQLAIAQSLVLEEERKVLLELSGLVGREAPALTDGLLASGELDEAEAAARMSNDLKAVTPLVADADGALRLGGLRHPRLVLKGDAVVANDVALDGDTRALVISGPNAGGKTITLTGVGLVALMTRAGLPVTCDPGSSVPLFTQVHSAVGDLQDLQAGLSTFSAHVTALNEVLATARSGALVLVDEIAADTDPREGAAIATAVLEALLDLGAVTLVTTHLEELKALAHVDPRFVNARVGFDAKRMTPTYRLQLGAAGQSSAIEVARRVGLGEAICARATALVKDAGGALSQALQAAEAERQTFAEQRDAAEADAAQARALKLQLEEELAQARRDRGVAELQFRSALKAELEFAKGQVRALLSQLQAQPVEKQVEKASAELTARVNEQARAERSLREAITGAALPSEPLTLAAGSRARHTGLDADVEILVVEGEQAQVAMGAMKMRVPVSMLGPARGAKAPSKFPTSRAETVTQNVQRAQQAAAAPVAASSPTLDLRGERAEDALRAMDRFLDRLTREGEQAGVILHGHGTGALKSMIREHLKHSPYAASFRSGEGGEGGDGVTIVQL